MSIPSWARVGAKVVCVHGFGGGERASPIHAGEIYVVRAVTHYPWAQYQYGLLLEGIHNQILPAGETGYAIWRFRPLITLEDDMEAHFRALLDVPAPTERERA